jgi:starch phosphorylase
VVLNGGLNCSVLDGWWAEAFDGHNGFAIGTGRTHVNQDVQDRRDADSLYEVLAHQVIPLYYDRDADDIPQAWVKRMKRGVRTLGWRFNADRMVMDYVSQTYVPSAGGTSCEISPMP